MTDEEARKLAEEHYKYTEKIILKMLELVHLQSVEEFVHGFKHGKEDKR